MMIENVDPSAVVNRPRNALLGKEMSSCLDGSHGITDHKACLMLISGDHGLGVNGSSAHWGTRV
jgi:hypothetical protein